MEAAPGLPLAEETVVILVLPPVTRHPAVRTPGFLEQPACPQAAQAAAPSDLGSCPLADRTNVQAWETTARGGGGVKDLAQ